MSGDYNFTQEQGKQLYDALIGKSEVGRAKLHKTLFFGSRKEIKRVLKARKEKEQSK